MCQCGVRAAARQFRKREACLRVPRPLRATCGRGGQARQSGRGRDGHRSARQRTLGKRAKTKIQAIYNGNSPPITMQGLAPAREKKPTQEQWVSMKKQCEEQWSPNEKYGGVTTAGRDAGAIADVRS